MDDVLGLIVILSLVVVTGSIAGLIALTKVSALQQEVALLKKQLHSVISKTSSQPATAVARFTSEQSHTAPIESELQSHVTNQQSVTVNHIPTHTVTSPRETNKRSHSAVSTFLAQLKNQLQQNWMTWIGGVALAFGGIFLAKYSLDAGILSPSLRLIVGGLFGLMLIAVAEFLHRKGIVFEGFTNYVPAALAGGGFISCFALTLLAYSSYGMLSSTVAFIMLAIIALAASSMALRLGHGKIIIN